MMYLKKKIAFGLKHFNRLYVKKQNKKKKRTHWTDVALEHKSLSISQTKFMVILNYWIK